MKWHWVENINSRPFCCKLDFRFQNESDELESREIDKKLLVAGERHQPEKGFLLQTSIIGYFEMGKVVDFKLL